MTSEKIIRMAREAGFSEWAVQTPQALERFYALAVADEREACAKVCDGWLHADGDQCAAAIRARGEE